MDKEFRSGFVSVIGETNVGKSTLVNKFVGEKISIVSNRPQTTRNKILSILTDDDSQIIFLDTPGVHKPKSKLSEFMLKEVNNSLNQVDLILYLVEPQKNINEINKNILDKLIKVSSPIILVINKTDCFSKNQTVVLETIEAYKNYGFKEIIAVSALNNKNLDVLLDLVKDNLKPGPKYFTDDMITDMPEREIICEFIREKILIFTQDEIPHGCAVDIDLMKKRENRNLIDVQANIYCEKESHKKIIIGHNGSLLKKIGSAARLEAQNLLGSKLNLKIWVKVKKNWRNNNFYLRQFGYYDKK